MDNDRIDAAIAAEERDLLRAIGEEPAYLSQVGALFSGRNAWVNGLLMAVQTVLFVGGVYAAVNFFAAQEPLAALRWGLPAATLLLMSLIIKLSMVPVMQVNRVMRAMAAVAAGSEGRPG